MSNENGATGLNQRTPMPVPCLSVMFLKLCAASPMSWKMAAEKLLLIGYWYSTLATARARSGSTALDGPLMPMLSSS